MLSSLLYIIPLCVLWTARAAPEWASCSEKDPNIECTSVTVPLDHKNVDDSRTVNIAVTRYKATDNSSQHGAVFVNPGGPGGSGGDFVQQFGPLLSSTTQGQFDIIGWDPRGVSQTSLRVSCFTSAFEEQASSLLFQQYGLNLPSTSLQGDSTDDSIKKDLTRQISRLKALSDSTAKSCFEKTGEGLPYVGTEAGVYDIDFMAKDLLGPDQKINYWGISYGSLIGQYMVQILSPERLGRVVIDGIMDPVIWSSYAHEGAYQGLDDLENLYQTFATSCASHTDACALSSIGSGPDIISAIDKLIDNLYDHPEAVFGLGNPGVVEARDLRKIIFGSMYDIRAWPGLAQLVMPALSGTWSPLLQAAQVVIQPDAASKNDSSIFAAPAIYCSDTKPYDPSRPPTSVEELVESTLRNVTMYGRQMADRFFQLTMCSSWDQYAGLVPRKSRYESPFGLANGTLETPILILSNHFDPVTPLVNAHRAKSRLGDNARLVHQTDGLGHCTFFHFSSCTTQKLAAYLVNGTILDDVESLCNVDSGPFENATGLSVPQKRGLDEEIATSWQELTSNWKVATLFGV